MARVANPRLAYSGNARPGFFSSTADMTDVNHTTGGWLRNWLQQFALDRDQEDRVLGFFAFLRPEQIDSGSGGRSDRIPVQSNPGLQLARTSPDNRLARWLSRACTRLLPKCCRAQCSCCRLRSSCAWSGVTGLVWTVWRCLSPGRDPSPALHTAKRVC